MKKISIYMMALLAGGFAMSCANNDLDFVEPEGQQPAQGNFRISATIDEISRTSVDEDSKIAWSTTDKISAWVEGGSSNAPLAWSESAEGATVATFSGDVTEPEAQSFGFYALYPYAESYGDNVESVALTIPSTVEQAKSINDLVGKSDFMLASKTLTKGEDYKATFTHPLAFVNIVIDGSTSIWSDGVIKSLTINAPVSIVGDVTANLKEKTISPADEAAGKTLTINFGEDAVMSAQQNAWVAINPALTDGTTNWEFVLLLTNGQQITFYVAPKKLEAQTKYTFTFNQIEKWIARRDNDHSLTTNYAAAKSYDLVADGGRANCYIIPNGGMYKFACDRPLQSDKSFTLSGITAADWLWATGEQSATSFTEADVPVYSVSMSGNNIFFRVKPNAKGNVIIAATNDSGEIVWSWHLWLLPNPEVFTTTHRIRGNGWDLAGCNLGATSNAVKDVNSYGFLYQWGRKDPFPGAGSIGSTTASSEATIFVDLTQKYVFNTKSGLTFKSGIRNSAMGSDDLDFITKNPTTFVHYNSEKVAGDVAGAGKNTWAYNLSLEEFKALWGSATNKKTVYDPCPAGYVVITKSDAWYNTTTRYADFTKDAEGVNGYLFAAMHENSIGSSYYPATGDRRSGKLTNVGFSGYYWACNFHATNNINCPYALSLEGGKKTSGQGQPQRAYPIRCQKQ
ncbi:MAG: hypothetical protein IKB18_04730 [Tidjanibacter sp.]|nr:hypothetical protein [Tidjanibacter sp.]